MHEYSIVLSLLERVAAVASEHEARSVKGLRVRIGVFAGVAPELLRSAFEIAREGTLCASAELTVESVEATWSCPGCGRSLEATGVLRCAECDEGGRLESGNEIVLQSVDLEVP